MDRMWLYIFAGMVLVGLLQAWTTIRRQKLTGARRKAFLAWLFASQVGGIGALVAVVSHLPSMGHQPSRNLNWELVLLPVSIIFLLYASDRMRRIVNDNKPQ